jgi:hypothetical protein
MVLENGIIVEIKGVFRKEDRDKHLNLKNQNPKLDIRFVFKDNGWLTKAHKYRYGDWCHKHGFIYSIGRVPLEWVKEEKCEHLISKSGVLITKNTPSSQ